MSLIDKSFPNIKKKTVELPGQDKITEVLAQELNREQEQSEDFE